MWLKSFSQEQALVSKHYSCSYNKSLRSNRVYVLNGQVKLQTQIQLFGNIWYAYLVDFSEGSSTNEAQISEALTEIRFLLTGVVHRARRGRFTQRIGERRPRGLMLREHPAQRGASLGWGQRRERIGASGGGRAGGVGRGRRGKRESALFEGEGLLCVGKVGREREGPPGRCRFHCSRHCGRMSSARFNQEFTLKNIRTNH